MAAGYFLLRLRHKVFSNFYQKKYRRTAHCRFLSIAHEPSQLSELLSQLQSSFQRLNTIRDWTSEQSRLQALDEQLKSPQLWEQPQLAGKLQKERAILATPTEHWKQLTNRYNELKELRELSQMEQDVKVEQEIVSIAKQLQQEVTTFASDVSTTDPSDIADCFMDIKPGAGGVESMDWAAMLMRMYIRWASASGLFKASIVDETSGEEAGVRRATIWFQGSYAFKWLRNETGVHRLIRMSPFDAQNRRHTSFASVNVYADEDKNDEIAINPADLRIDVFRSSGPGGQHVNTTESAVRVTHIPTGLVAQSQSDRSQHRNKAQAMAVLKAKLKEQQRQKKQLEHEALKASRPKIAWGSQVRSYTLQPYQLVKDHRTQVEHRDPAAVLDGDIEKFLVAFWQEPRE